MIQLAQRQKENMNKIAGSGPWVYMRAQRFLQIWSLLMHAKGLSTTVGSYQQCVQWPNSLHTSRTTSL
jgi:hypothetical protein